MTERRVAKQKLKDAPTRPANYQTPVEFFCLPITPNDAFYVRSHGIPPRVDERAWRLEIGGDAARETASMSLDRLRDMPAHEITAVCYCACNRRSLYRPKAPGVQWGDGAMGCAVWKGARLKDVLAAAAPRREAIELWLTGADQPATDENAPFFKCLPMSKVLDENVLLAYEMNGAPLPEHNGAPVRVVVPGWTATYWVKHVSALTISARPFAGHWMSTDYRVPRGKFGALERFETQEDETTAPVTEVQVNSLIADARRKDDAIDVSGLAWDGGHGIASVDLSADGGATWSAATLGEDLGRFAFRPWTCALPGARRGAVTVMARATNTRGQTQPMEAVPNPLGYYYNAVQRLTLPD